MDSDEKFGSRVRAEVEKAITGIHVLVSQRVDVETKIFRNEMKEAFADAVKVAVSKNMAKLRSEARYLFGYEINVACSKICDANDRYTQSLQNAALEVRRLSTSIEPLLGQVNRAIQNAMVEGSKRAVEKFEEMYKRNKENGLG